jgi:predicted phosphodiesterase
VAGRITSIGLISDTHGLLRDAALEAWRGSQLTMHAGDATPFEVKFSEVLKQ